MWRVHLILKLAITCRALCFCSSWMWAAAHLGLSWEWRESAQRWECRCCCRHCSLDCRFLRCCHYRERERETGSQIQFLAYCHTYHISSEVCSMHAVCSMWIFSTPGWYTTFTKTEYFQEYCIPQCNVMEISTVIFISTHFIRLPEDNMLLHKIKMWGKKRLIGQKKTNTKNNKISAVFLLKLL